MQTAVMRSESRTGQETGSYQYQFEAEAQTQEQFTRTVDNWSSRKWLIRDPLSAHIHMDRCQSLQTFGVVLKSMFETRYIMRDDEPYSGGELCSGGIPARWSITVPTPVSYTQETRYVRICADERVVMCYVCNGTGRVIHKKCSGTGRLPCPNTGSLSSRTRGCVDRPVLANAGNGDSCREEDSNHQEAGLQQ